MTFTSVPKDFTPPSQGLVFSFSTDDGVAGDIKVEIIDADIEEVIATQHLYGVSEGSVNISPYLPRKFEREPSLLAYSTFVGVPTARYAVRVNGTTSPSVVVAPNCEQVAPRTLLTDYPLSRRIAYGERDEVVMVVEQNDSLSAEILLDGEEYSTIESLATSPMMLFQLASEEFDSAISTIEVVIRCGGERLATLYYKVAPHRDSDVRLAWVSRVGSIERYTFPMALSLSSSGEVERVRGEQLYEVASVISEAVLEVTSHYEPRAGVASLAEIITSPRVWMEVGDEALRVESMTDVVQQSLYGEPSRVKLQLRLWREEVSLW